jgi:hypothetical protein
MAYDRIAIAPDTLDHAEELGDPVSRGDVAECEDIATRRGDDGSVGSVLAEGVIPKIVEGQQACLKVSIQDERPRRASLVDPQAPIVKGFQIAKGRLAELKLRPACSA